jgi:acyl carrier protein
LNPARKLCAAGELGEIHVRTPYLSKGYLDDQHLTSMKFIKNPYGDSSKDIIYKTGDLGRYSDDGNVIFCGRADRQVSIRGFRIELGDIECHIRELSEIANVLVEVIEDSDGEKRLVAYYVPKNNCICGLSNLRRHLLQKLPQYMMPQVFIEIKSIPLSPNGKVNRNALPKLNFQKFAYENYIAPRNDMETKIAAIWKEVLKQEKVGVQNDFFDLGGHSLLATQVLSRLNQSLNIKLPLRKLFEARTVEAVARLIETSFWSTGVRQPSRENMQDEREIVEL